MPLGLDTSVLHDPEIALRYEWLETNGVGGWAGSTVLNANTRRYHGLLVSAENPPVGRVVVLSKLDETLVISGRRYDLGSSVYHDTIHPGGYRHLERFDRDLFPVFTFRAGGVVLKKTVAGIWGRNATVVLYDVIEAPSAFTIELQPFVAVRDYHHLMQANDSVRTLGHFQDSTLQATPYDGGPTLYLRVPGATYRPAPDWYYRFEYAREAERGLDCHEDLFTYGCLSVTAQPGGRIEVTADTSLPDSDDASVLFSRERDRREALLVGADDLSRTLRLAADQFIVQRAGELRTILAGYHWFTDWGRDTMIALPGIALSTGRADDARKILKAFADSVDQGMIPNRFPDAGEQPDYNTVDASLWFFVAAYRYGTHTGDWDVVAKDLLPVLRDIVDWHERGTRYGISVCEDGLLAGGDPGVQLTWMDAKVGDWVVTPRHGKAVEINALWYNALMILSKILHDCGQTDEAVRLSDRADGVREAFGKAFWNERKGCLYDCILDGEPDPAVRPNQVFAISLPFPLLSDDRAESVLAVVETELVTPVGLRSLSPSDPAYRGRYGGDQVERDGAYHQGTVWPWLMGPFITALCRYRGDTGRRAGAELIEGFRRHLGEACVGSISEVFDGDPPHDPRGTVAQAWSVGECLRCYLEDVNPPR